MTVKKFNLSAWARIKAVSWERCIFAGAARRAGPDSMLILRLSVCLSEIISRPLIGQKSATSPGIVAKLGGH